MEVVVNNNMQHGYTYLRIRPAGDIGDLERMYGFRPELTPKEMLALGVFGGKYFNDVANTDEYPRDWWPEAKLSGLGNPADPSLNFLECLHPPRLPNGGKRDG